MKNNKLLSFVVISIFILSMLAPVSSINIEGEELEHDDEQIAKNAIINRHNMNWWYSQDEDIKEAIKSSKNPSTLSPNQKDIINEATQTSGWRGYIGNYYENWMHIETIVHEDNSTTWNELEEISRNVTNGTAVNTHNTTSYTDVQVNETHIIRTINTTMYFEQINDVIASGYNWTKTEGWQLIENIQFGESWYFYNINDTSISFDYWQFYGSSGSNWEYVGYGIGIPKNWTYQETLNWFTELITFEEIIIPLDTNTTIELSDEIKIGNPVDITGTVTDKLGNVVGNILINVNVNGQDFSTKVDEFGNWLVKYLPTTHGNFDINVTWEGNKYFNPFVNSHWFYVDEPTVIDENETIGNNETQKFHQVANKTNIDAVTDNSSTDMDAVEKNLNENNDTLKDSLAKANMENTGMPIIIALLVFLSSLGLITRKK